MVGDERLNSPRGRISGDAVRGRNPTADKSRLFRPQNCRRIDHLTLQMAGRHDANNDWHFVLPRPGPYGCETVVSQRIHHRRMNCVSRGKTTF
jgi:hypothetical protein